jgi:uncharacterized protein (DUF1778 family)
MYYMPEAQDRDEVMTVRLSRDERNMVKGLAAADGVSLSDAIRMSVRRAHAERFATSRKGGK